MVIVKTVDVVSGAVTCYITIQVILLVVEVPPAENYREGVSGWWKCGGEVLEGWECAW